MDWFCWRHGAVSDAKWPIVARKAQVNVGIVVAVWGAILECASQNDERGLAEGFDCETYDVLYGFEDGVCERVLGALKAKGLIVDGKVANWDKIQPGKKARGAGRMRGSREMKGSPLYNEDGEAANEVNEVNNEGNEAANKVNEVNNEVNEAANVQPPKCNPPQMRVICLPACRVSLFLN